MSRRYAPFALLLATLVAACSGDDADGAPPASDDAGAETSIEAGAPDSSTDAATDATTDATDAATDASDPGEGCLQATGAGAAPTSTYVDGPDQATVTVSGAPCKRTYVLSTTAPLRDGEPGNPRTIVELDGQPIVRTRNDLFDALHALALEEAKENSVEAIQDGAFDDGKPWSCPPGGCFETGRKWQYVWTRDTAYAVDLGLAAVDPTRSANSLLFKLSERRAGGGLEIVQDTGSGGSWPISTDRVVWAIGARELLDWLDGDARTQLRDRAYDAMKNTIERDRIVVFDPSDGLYRGEQSFLDWREQSYPPWTAQDTVHLGMSKALSTNVGHLAILEAAAALATEKGDTAAATRYQSWATSLRAALGARMWLPDDKQFSSLITTTLDPSPTRRFDALGTALAVLYGVGTDAQAKDAIASYPHLVRGVPVLWPQQKETAIYHNRAIWPFVTAYFARAAKKVRNDAAVENAVSSLVRGAALNLSNMENLEMVSGRPWVDDGSYSGPVVNSQRQLWSVAGFLGVVREVIFGIEAEPGGLRFRPFVTKKMRNGLFANADSIALDGLAYKGRRLGVVVKLPAKGSAASGGAYAVSAIRVDGATVGVDEVVAPSKLGPKSVVEIDLVDAGETGSSIHLVTAVADYRNLFGPRPPAITNVAPAGGSLRVEWSPSGEEASEVSFDVYRDGVRVAAGLPGGTTSWTDASATPASSSVCYAIEARFVVSKNRSQHSAPWCWWGTGALRVTPFPASTFTWTGGTPSTSHGRFHHDAWGDPGHALEVTSFVAAKSGKHLIQLVAGNGGPISTGITCGIKRVEVRDGATVVGRGYVTMPHLGGWDRWADSSFVEVTLTAGKSYRIVVDHDDAASNMSFFDHFSKYGGAGGKDGAFSHVNVAELRVLQVAP